MKLNSNIILKWHHKLNDSIHATYTSPKASGMKPHSFFTILAIFMTDTAPVFFNSMNYQTKYFQTFALIYKSAYLLAIICLCIYAIYCWKVYLNLRREGRTNDKNIFFAESAGICRKVIFYLALVPELIINFSSRLHPENTAQQMDRLRYQLQSEFYREAGIDVLKTIIFSILIVELSRLLFPKTFSWSNRTHVAVVIVTAIVLSCLRVTALNFASGHGII
jgi:hypothetical protein